MQVPADTLGLIVELLCFCVQHHSYRIKYYILRNNVVDKVLKLLQRRERHLVRGGFGPCLASATEGGGPGM